MKNFMTVKQLMSCARTLRNNGESAGRIAAEKRELLEGIWNMPADKRTDDDVKKADMIEGEYKHWLDEEGACLLLAGIIEDLKVEVILKTEDA